MSSQVRLIKEVSAVFPGLPARSRAPNVGVVYATADGALGSYPDWRPMTFREQLRTRYRRRYDVDMSDHRRRAYLRSIPLPARGDFYHFIADVEVGFRAHDPEELVRRDVTDAARLVYFHLADEFRRITRKYDIEDSELAEAEIARRFDVEDVLPDGVTVFHVAPRLGLDENARRYLRDKQEAIRRVLVGRAEHKAEIEEARQRGELSRMNRDFERQMAEREFTRMNGEALDAYAIVRHHLARHPDDTVGALDLMVKHRKAWMEHQEQYNKRTAELFQSMMSSKLVQAADMEKLLPQMLGQLGIVPAPVPVEAAVGAQWTEPPVLADEEVAPAGLVQPVYLVLDESVAAEELVPHLNDQLPGMLARIAAEATPPGIRLAVLGFARHLTVRRKLGVLGGVVETPPTLSVGDPAAYALLFAALGDRLDTDATEAGVAPLVYLLTAGAAEDDWTVARGRLTDPELREPPIVVAFGIGDAPPEQVAAMASGEGNAFQALPGLDPAIAARLFADFTVRDLRGRLARADGDRAGPAVPPPEGFAPAVGAS